MAATYDQLIARANSIRTAVVEESITASSLGQLLVDIINFISASESGSGGSISATQLSQLQSALKDITFSAQAGKISVTLTKNDSTTITRNIPASTSSASGLMTSTQYTQLANLVTQYNTLVTALPNKQDKLTAGTNVKIQNNIISAEGGRKVLLHSTTCTLREISNGYIIYGTVENVTINEYDVGYIVLTNATQRIAQKITVLSDGTDCILINGWTIQISKAYLESLLPGYTAADILFEARRRETFFLLRATPNFNSRGTISPYSSTAKGGSTVSFQANPASGYKLRDISWLGADGETKTLEVSSNRFSFIMPFHDTQLSANFFANSVQVTFGTLEHLSSLKVIYDNNTYDSVDSFLEANETINAGTYITFNMTFESGYQLSYVNVQYLDSGNNVSPAVSDDGFTVSVTEKIKVNIYAIASSSQTGIHHVVAPTGANISFGTTVISEQSVNYNVTEQRSYYATAQPGYKIASWELLTFGSGYTYPTYTSGSPLVVPGTGEYRITVVVEVDEDYTGGGSDADSGTLTLDYDSCLYTDSFTVTNVTKNISKTVNSTKLTDTIQVSVGDQLQFSSVKSSNAPASTASYLINGNGIGSWGATSRVVVATDFGKSVYVWWG